MGGVQDMRGGGGPDHYGRRGPNGGRDANGSDPVDAAQPAQPDESASDPVG